MAVMPLSEIKCPVNITDFPQYDGFAQYEQIVAIQTPLIYDQCLLKKCLMDSRDPRLQLNPPVCPPTQQTVVGLNGVLNNIPINTPLNFREFRNFTASITNVSATQISSAQKLVTVTYNISFIADVLQGNTNISMPISLTGLSESVTLNCPDSSSQISVSTGNDPATDEPIFKLEILPDLVSSSAYFVTTPTDNAQLVNATVYFTLCYTLVIKCELNVQMLIPFYGFFEQGRPCSGGGVSPDVCPCTQCMNTPASQLYPPIDFTVFNCGANNQPSSTSSNNIKPSTGNEIIPAPLK